MTLPQAEVIDNPSGVLDLTGGASENPDDQNPAPDADVTDPEVAPEKSDEEPDVSDTDPDGDGDAPDADPDETGGDDADSADNVEHYFGGVAVKVDVPDEVKSALEEAGLKVEEVTSQLFKKDGDFSLDETTRKALEDKFGKTIVDGYLNLYKGQNQAALAAAEADKAARAATEEQQGKEYAEAVGGEEGLVAMESYISKSFSDEQLAAYNAVMENGDHGSQMLIISQVKQMMDMASKLENGDTNIQLAGDKGAQGSEDADVIDKGYLTAEEFQEVMREDKYWNDSKYQQAVDAARLAGKRKGL